MWDKVLTGIGFIVFALIVYGVLVLVRRSNEKKK